MNFKTTVILIILLIIVGGVFVYTQNHAKHPADDQSQALQPGEGGQKILDLGSATVQSLSITNATGEKTSIEKAGTGWNLTEPEAEPAVEWQTTDLVRSLTDLRSQGRPENVSPGDTGLEQPQYRVELNTSDGKTIHLVIGSQTGVGDVMYAQVDGGDVYLIDSGLAKTLKAAGTDLRDKKLLTVASAAVKQFRITSGNETLAGELVNGKWKITEPMEEPGDEPTITSLLSTITTTEASEFVKPDSEELAFARLDHPLTTVWVSTAEPSTQPSAANSSPPSDAGAETLSIGAPDSLAKDHYFVRMSSGITAKVASSVLDNFKKTALDLRDKNVVSIPSADVQTVSIVKTTYPAPPTTQATQPSAGIATTMPSSTKLVELTLRPKVAPAMGPVLTSQPSTRGSSTQPTTQPEELPSKWQLASDPKTQVADTKVSAILEKFEPLHADKFLEAAPPGVKSQRYLLTINTGADGSAGNRYQIEIDRPADGDAPYAVYDGLAFEVSSAILDALDTDFHKTTATP